MNFYIKEWPDNTATLMTEFGRVVWTFASIEEAEENCYEIAESEKLRRKQRVFHIKDVAA
jgi:hypothetical protein